MTSSTPQHGTHRRESASLAGLAARYPLARLTVLEFFITAGILFLIATAVRWVFAPDAPLADVLNGTSAQVVFGIFFGIANTVIVHFSMSRQTAGHMNPSVTIGLWLLRGFPGRNVAPFCVAQMCGSVAGVWLASLAWGPVMDVASVRHAAVGPAEGWNLAGVLAVETAAQMACMTIVAALMLRPRISKFIPFAVGGSIGCFIIFLGPIAGGAVNPARQFGPAVLSGHFAFLAAYLIGPVLGAAGAAALAAALRPPAAPSVSGTGDSPAAGVAQPAESAGAAQRTTITHSAAIGTSTENRARSARADDQVPLCG